MDWKRTHYLKLCLQSLRNARWSIVVVAIAYLFAAAVGAAMAHAGNSFALSARDRLVGAAQSGVILTQSNALVSALLDAGGNFISGLVSAVLGLAVILPFPLILYRGWLGGIVSVNGDHISRFSNLAQATYYLSVLLLQLGASSLVAGAGLHVGLANFRSPKDRLIWLLGLPAGPFKDGARIILLSVPLFLLGSW